MIISKETAKLMDEAININNGTIGIRPKGKEIYRLTIRPKGSDSAEKQWLKILAKVNIFIIKGGWLNIPRWDNGKKINQLFEGIDTAYRAQEHILKKYLQKKEGEIDKIHSWQEMIKRINLFLVNWKKAKSEKREKEMLNLITSIITDLEFCQNFFKINARGQIEEILFLEDSLQRTNPGALAARTLSALNELSQRLIQAEAIIPMIALRKQIIGLEIKRLQARIKKAKNKIDFILRIKPVKEAESIYANKVVKFIKEAEKDLTTIWVSPFRERKIQACAELAKAKKIISYNSKQAKSYLETAKEILDDEKIKIL